MEVIRDMFGNELYIGDCVVYADNRIGTKDVGLDFYVVTSIEDGVVMGLLSSGEYMGDEYYLENTSDRAALIRNPYKTTECFGDTLLS